MTIVYRADGKLIVMYRSYDGVKCARVMPNEAATKAFVIAKGLCKCPGTFISELSKAKDDMDLNGDNAVEFGMMNDMYMYTTLVDDNGADYTNPPVLH